MKDLIKKRVQQSDSEDNSSHSSQNIEAKQEQMNLQMQRIQQQLKNMPYELIIKQKKAIEQGEPQPNSKPSKKEKNTPKLKKIIKKKIEKQQRKDKNDAIEVSIYQKPKYKQVKLFQEKRKTIDPRFQSYAGNYNPELAAKSFSFIPKLQQAEMKEIKSKLNGSSRKTKLNEHQKEILSKEYNRVTNDYRRFEILQLQKQTKKQIKQKYGEQFHLKKQTFKQQFQKKKLSTMNEADREKKLKEKDQQARRSQLSERRKTLKMNPFK